MRRDFMRKTKPRLVSDVRTGRTLKQACRRADVSWRTVARWRARDSEFDLLLQRAALHAAASRIKDGWQKLVTEACKTTGVRRAHAAADADSSPKLQGAAVTMPSAAAAELDQPT